MYTQMKFTDTGGNIDFSELFDDNTIIVHAYGGGNNVKLYLTEKEMRELRKHLTIQIRKIKIL